MSLLEVIVVLAIVGILFALLLSAVQKTRASAARLRCQGNLKQLAHAIHNFESQHGVLPPGAISGPFPSLGVPDGANHSIWTVLLPYVEQDNVQKAYHFELNYDHNRNQSAVTTEISILTCSLQPPNRREEWEKGGYGAVTDFAPIEVNAFLADIGVIDGVGKFEGPLPVNGRVAMDDISDGLSQTLLIVEAGGRPGMAWSSSIVPVGLRQILGGVHGDVSLVVMCDGSLRLLKSNMPLRLLGRMATRSGGEVVLE